MIEVPMPKKILLSENRRSDRFPIPENLYIYVKFQNPNSSTDNKNQRSSFKIFDFGRQGISINMTKKDSHYFEINNDYEISTINGKKLPKSFKATLIYQKVHTYIKNAKTQVLFKAGFKLKIPLPEEIYQQLLALTDQKESNKKTA